MKNISLALGLTAAAVASSLAFLPASSVKAANVTAENGVFNFSGTWEFTFEYSFGAIKTELGVDPGATTLFSELNGTSPNGGIVPGTKVTYTFTGAAADFFSKNLGNNTSFTSSATAAPGSQGFWIVNSSNQAATLALLPFTSNDPSSTGGVPNPGTPANKFKDLVSTFNFSGGAVLIGVNDDFGDRDFNDFIVSARPVPVPAIVPGVILAGLYFGSRTLKRKQAATAKAAV
ncbi:hypothetical protein TUMEXPCC7403_10220 [Tumidithrix helvetica PCC 7403]|uniref:hypothetical protein n=1 Tax=Tumidithrix helvetica TaxID=3457545 RepID=UPI003CA6674C